MDLKERLKNYILPITSEAQDKLRLCYEIAKDSPDLSCKNGAIIYDNWGVEVSRAYNRFPKGVAVSQERLTERPKKYFFAMHAERLAAIEAMRNQGTVPEGELWANWTPCDICATELMEAGVKKVYTHLDVLLMDERLGRMDWLPSLEAAWEMMDEKSVEYKFFEGKVGGVENLHSGKIWTP